MSAQEKNEKKQLLEGIRVISLHSYKDDPVTGGEIYNYQVFCSLKNNGATLRHYHLPLESIKHVMNARVFFTPWIWLAKLMGLNEKNVIVVDNSYAFVLAIPMVILRIFTPIKIIVLNHLSTVHTTSNPLKKLAIWSAQTILLRVAQVVLVNSALTFKQMKMAKFVHKVYFLRPPITVNAQFVNRRERKRESYKHIVCWLHS